MTDNFKICKECNISKNTQAFYPERKICKICFIANKKNNYKNTKHHTDLQSKQQTDDIDFIKSQITNIQNKFENFHSDQPFSEKQLIKLNSIKVSIMLKVEDSMTCYHDKIVDLQDSVESLNNKNDKLTSIIFKMQKQIDKLTNQK